MIKLNFKNDEKITKNKIINLLFTDFDKKSETALNIIDTVSNFFEKSQKDDYTLNLTFNSEKRKNLLDELQKVLNDEFFKILKTISNNEFKKILDITLKQNFSLIFKITTKLENITACTLQEKQASFKGVINSLIKAIIFIKKLYIVQNTKNQVIICDFDTWQDLQQKANENYTKTLEKFFDDGTATNLQPLREKYTIIEK